MDDGRGNVFLEQLRAEKLKYGGLKYLFFLSFTGCK
jgi:hypothetical protein